ncbi:hypothetical protein AB1N83_012717 [Pleurotus pulmonarius]
MPAISSVCTLGCYWHCKTSIGLVGRHLYTTAGLLVAEPDSGLRVLNAASRHPPGNRYCHVSSALPCSLPLPHSFPCIIHITRLPKAVMDALIIRSSRQRWGEGPHLLPLKATNPYTCCLAYS